MEIAEMQECLVELYFANITRNERFKENNGGSVFLLGPPGVGKTTGTKRTAEIVAPKQKKEFIFYSDGAADKILANPEKYFLFVYFNLHACEPSDLGGYPEKHEQGMANIPPLWAVCLSQAGGILFLDEFTNIQRPDVLSVSQNLILEHRCGFTEFSKEVMVIAAGNNPKDSSLANLLPVPIVDKFTFYEIDCPKVESWAKWMDENYGDAWDRRALGYLTQFGEEFLKLPEETETLTNFPTPRSWTENATRLPLQSKKFHRETLIGSLGPETGEKYYGYLQTSVPGTEELMLKPEEFQNLTMDGKYLSSVMLGSWLKSRFNQGQEEKKIGQEIEKTLPLIRAMKNVQHDFVILSIISSGDKRIDVALTLSRKDKEIAGMLERIATLRAQVES